MTATLTRPARVPATRLPSERIQLSHAQAWEMALAAGAGDREALAEMYRLYADDIRRYLLRHLSGRADADDLAQDVWVRALRKLPTVEPSASAPAAWLMTVARNLAADYWKAGAQRFAGTMPEQIDTVVPMWQDESTDPADEVADEIAAAIANRTVRAAVLDLPDEQRDVIVCRFLRQMPIEETAAALGINEGAVKARQYRATRALARTLSRNDFRPEGE